MVFPSNARIPRQRAIPCPTAVPGRVLASGVGQEGEIRRHNLGAVRHAEPGDRGGVRQVRRLP